MKNFIHPIAFFSALFFGLLICYVTAPKLQIVYKYPTPDNVGKIIYKDDSDVCYKYKLKSVKCPINEEDIEKTNIHNINNNEINNETLEDRFKNFFNNNK
jgi:hypothetical protein